MTIGSLVISACSFFPDHPAFLDVDYKKWMDKTVEKTERKADYRRIPIDTNDQVNHFYSLSYKAYKEEISKQEFIKEMERKYPGYSVSIRWIAEQLPEYKAQNSAKSTEY
jgi:hypothetical protein